MTPTTTPSMTICSALRSTLIGWKSGFCGNSVTVVPRLAIALDGHFFFQADHHDLAIADLGLTTDRHQIAIENAGVAHAHALHPQQVMRARIEQREIQAVAGLDVLGGQDGLAGSHPAHQGQALFFSQRLIQSDGRPASRSLMPRDVPGRSSMTPLRFSARRCSSAALADRKPSSRAISARVGGIPVSSINL